MTNETNQHPDHVVGWSGSVEELAQAIGNMRYDAMAQLIHLLSQDILTQAKADAERNRVKLAVQLEDVWDNLVLTQASLQATWAICKPFMTQEG
jgi:hypothetical protein